MGLIENKNVSVDEALPTANLKQFKLLLMCKHKYKNWKQHKNSDTINKTLCSNIIFCVCLIWQDEANKPVPSFFPQKIVHCKSVTFEWKAVKWCQPLSCICSSKSAVRFIMKCEESVTIRRLPSNNCRYAGLLQTFIFWPRLINSYITTWALSCGTAV